MKTDLVKLVGAISLSHTKLHGHSKRNLEDLFKIADEQFPGLQEAFKKHLQLEKDNAKARLEELAIELDGIFAKGNKEACAKCNKGSIGNEPNDPKTGCCQDCWGSHGHFDYYSGRIEFRKALGELMDRYGWDHVYGFWSKNGCVLPRRYRSITCLRASCGTLDRYVTEKQRTRQYNITEEMRRLRELTHAVLI